MNAAPPRDDGERVAAAYRRFAATEAHGRSPLYEALATGVAADREIIAFLLTLPREKRQPNLLLAAARHRFGVPGGWADFRQVVLGNPEKLRTLMLRRSTQTNEPARCAVLLPVLARLPQPLALLEIGASAGLCLLPDRYAYDYGGHRLQPTAASPAPPVFRCAASPATPLPTALPPIAWRAGLDLNPLDLADPAETAWLETLVWPEQSERLARLRAAMAVAAADRPRIVAGDLRHDLAALADDAPGNTTRVIFHTAVVAYVSDRGERERFAYSVRALCDVWISNEAPQVFPKIARRAGKPGPPGFFLLALNGQPVAWTDPHGAAIEWIASC